MSKKRLRNFSKKLLLGLLYYYNRLTTDKGLEYVKNVRFKSQVFSQQVHAGAVLREPQQGQPDEHSPI